MKLYNPDTVLNDGYLLLLTSNTHVKSIIIYKVENKHIKCLFGEYTDHDNSNNVNIFNINPALCEYFDFSDVIANLSTSFFMLDDDEVITNVLLPIL